MANIGRSCSPLHTQMELFGYKNLLENEGAKCYLSKPYGLELLFLLAQFESDNADNGIEDTYEALSYFKPRRGAFSKHIQNLEASGHIIKIISKKKASKSVLRMSADVAKAFKEFNES